LASSVLGALGSNIARAFASEAFSATITNRRGGASLGPLISELGPSIKAGTFEEATSPEIVLVAVRWVDLESVLGRVATWSNRIVIDATNAVEFSTRTRRPQRSDQSSRRLWHQGDRSRSKHSSQVFASSFAVRAW